MWLFDSSLIFTLFSKIETQLGDILSYQNKLVAEEGLEPPTQGL